MPINNFRVMLKEEAGDKFTMIFDCYADDPDHAEEQAINAYPNGEVVDVVRLPPPMANE